jgi:hypothetical protein
MLVALSRHHAAAAECVEECGWPRLSEVESQGNGVCRVDWYVWPSQLVGVICLHAYNSAIAVGRDVFRPDGNTLVELLMRIQSERHYP